MHESKSPPSHRSKKFWLKLIIPTAGVIILIVGAWLVFHATHHTDPNQAALKKLEQNLSYPLYYPANLPSYYFLDRGTISSSNGIVLFQINRNDGKKISVTEESLPSKFNLNQITGTRASLPNVGKLVIGTGFQGYRAAITAQRTLIFISAPNSIGSGDFSIVTKSFKPV